MMMSSNDEFISMFEEKLKMKSVEKFAILLCDLDKSPPQQKDMLSKILFHDHKNSKYWSDYIKYCIQSFPNRKLQLQRLVAKSLELLDEALYKDNEDFVNIHIQSALLKANKRDSSKYFMNIIWKKNIGRKFSFLYLQWAELEEEKSAIIDILQKGLLSNAEPRQLIQQKLQSFNNLDAQKHFDDDEIELNLRQNKEKPIEEEDDNDTAELKTAIKSLDVNFSSQPLIQKESSVPVVEKLKMKDNIGKAQRVAPRRVNKSVHNEEDEEVERPIQVDDIQLPKKRSQPSTVKSVAQVKFPSKSNTLGRLSEGGEIDEDDNWRNEISFHNDSSSKSSSSSSSYSNHEDITVKMPLLESTKKSDVYKFKSSDKKNVHSEIGNIQSKKFNVDEIILAAVAEDDLSTDGDTLPLPLAELLGKSFASNSNNPPTGANTTDDKTHRRVSFLDVETNNINHTGCEATQPSKSKRKLSSNSSNSSNTSSTSSNTISFNNYSRNENELGTRLFDSNHIVMLNGKRYIQLSILGKGGSSTVYRVLSEDMQHIYAYKRVDVRGCSNDSCDADSVFNSYTNEIELLQKLKGSPYIIELIDAEINREEMYVSMLMEAGDTDLAKVLSSKQKNKQQTYNPFFYRLIWQEMLEAVDYIHNNRIVHGDLKPANFVFVKGHLKLIDFGIAKAFSNDTTNIYRESQIGTVNYMAPEAIAPTQDGTGNFMKLGRASDIWSLGCILYQVIYGYPPFAQLNTIQKLHAIPNPKHEILFPQFEDSEAINTVKLCLIRDANCRATIRGSDKTVSLMNHAFLKLNNHSHQSNQEQLIESLLSSDIIEKMVKFIQPLISNKSNSRSIVNDLIKIINERSNNKAASNSNMAIILPHEDTISFKKDSSFIESDLNITVEQTMKLVSKSSSRESRKDQHDIKRVKISTETSSNVSKRQPLKVLPLSLQEQIQNQIDNGLQSAKTSSRAQKWMKPKDVNQQKDDMKSILEKRIGAMRRFLEVEEDQENNTRGEFNEGNSFF